MTFSVKDKAEYLGTLRWVEVTLMETVASWVPTTPEMEIKVLFGRHVWEFAQSADALGKRTFELRAPLHYTIPPTSSLEAAIRELQSVEETSERIAVLYDAVLPAVTEWCEQYLKRTDELQDEPSVRAIERILDGHKRMLRERKDYSAEVPKAPEPRDQAVRAWREKLQTREFVVPGEGRTLARAHA